MSPPPGQWIPIPELSDEFDCAGPEPTLRYRDEHASFETPDHGCTIDTNKWRGVDTWLGQPWTWMPPNSAGANIWQGALALTLTYDEHTRPGLTALPDSFAWPGAPLTFYYRGGAVINQLRGFGFGYIEARIKGASRWPGVCPAFWLWRKTTRPLPGLPPSWLEIDVVEMQQDVDEPMELDFRGEPLIRRAPALP